MLIGAQGDCAIDKAEVHERSDVSPLGWKQIRRVAADAMESMSALGWFLDSFVVAQAMDDVVGIRPEVARPASKAVVVPKLRVGGNSQPPVAKAKAVAPSTALVASMPPVVDQPSALLATAPVLEVILLLSWKQTYILEDMNYTTNATTT